MIASLTVSPGVNPANFSSGPAAGGRGVGIHPNVDKSGRWLITPGCTVSHSGFHYRVDAVDSGVLRAFPVNHRGLIRKSAGSASFRCADVLRVTL